MKCNLCHSNSNSLVNFGNFPIAHHYMKTVTQKEFSYPLELALCDYCNHIFIFNPISPDILYKNYITLSDWKFEPHIPRLLELMKLNGVANDAKILEIGSNDGKFLHYLRDAGYCNVVGIEPTEDSCLSAMKKNIETIHGFFNEGTAEKYIKKYGKCELLIIRQVLEHITDLKNFSRNMKNILQLGALVFIEVPDFESYIAGCDYALWEEHVNYFTHDTLRYFLEKINIEEVYYETFVFAGTCQLIIGRLSKKLNNKM